MTVTRKIKEDINMVVKTVGCALTGHFWTKPGKALKVLTGKKKSKCVTALYKLTGLTLMMGDESLGDQQSVHFTLKCRRN